MNGSLRYIQVGDTVRRMLAGVLEHKLTVTEVTAGTIVCGPWVFDRWTGMEIDDELEHSPSFITPVDGDNAS